MEYLGLADFNWKTFSTTLQSTEVGGEYVNTFSMNSSDYFESDVELLIGPDWVSDTDGGYAYSKYEVTKEITL